LPAWPTACQGTNSIEAVYSGSGSYQTSNYTLTELVEAHATGTAMSGPSQFCNTGPIVSPDETAGMLYPSVIGVSGYANGTTVGNVTVELEGATATTQNAGLNDQFLLVAPGGGANNLDFLDEAFVGNGISDVSLTVADGGTNPFDMTPTTGDTYEPYDHNVDNPNDIWATSSAPTYDANIPQVPGTINRPQTVGGANAYTLEQAFSGAPANGDWALYVFGVSPNTLSGGWCINLTPNTGNPTATTVTSTYPKATTGQSVTITATVGSSDGTPTGTVTFVDSTLGTTLASNTPLSGGVATYITTAFAEGDHKITATYTPTGDFNASFGYVWQRVDDATVVSAVNATTWQYCNTGPVEIQPGIKGAYTPNPSNIFVTSFPGTLNTMALTLENFSLSPTGIYETASLIEGPSGAALDFFSNTGGTTGSESATLGNYVFEDSAGELVPDNDSDVSPSSYRPTAYPPSYDSSDTFISSISGYYPAPGTFTSATTQGSGTFGSVFPSGTNPDGTWSLFFNEYLGEGVVEGAANGWCLQLVNNPINVAVNLPATDTFTQGQQNASFTVDIVNNGPGSTGDPTGGSNPMTVEDGLISVFSYSNFSGTGWSCSANGHLVTCTNDSSVPDGQAYPELTIDVNVSSTASGSYLNNVGVNGAGVGPTLSNNDTITVLASTTTSALNSETGYGAPAVPLQATVTSSSGAVNSGSVIFTLFSGSNQVGTSTSGAVSNGSASVLYTLPPGTPPGSYTIQAVYSGSSTFAGSSDNTHTVTEIQAPTTTSASNATTDYSSSPQSVSLSATVTSPVGAVNAGTVTFTVLNSGVLVGTATTSGTVSSGSASVSYTLPAATTIGNYTIQAVYNGSTDFAASSDNTHTLTVAQTIGTCTTPNPNPNPNPESFAAVGDFNGDCKSDILWRNTGTEQVYEWLMNGTTFNSSGSPGSLTSDWVIQDAGDFNADGKADILWRNSTTGEVVIWLMNGTTMTSSTSLGNVSSDWSIAGVGDFNGDGYADILWQNTSGELYLWLMNGTTIAGGGIVGNVSSGWNVAGIGDFNGDGDADILWRNSTSGQVYVWLMNGTTIASMGSPGTPTSDWSIAGVGDFDGNGTSDILWRNSTTGQAYIWFMNGTTFPSSGSVSYVTSDWVIQGVGDYDGSGRAGILWRNSTTEQVYIWLMNGTTIGSMGSPGTPDATWQIAPLSP
jgi:hypothetical protein